MPILPALLMLVLHLLTGLGVLRLCRYESKPAQNFALGLLLGLPISSLSVFFLDLLGVRLTLPSILLAAALLMLAVNVPSWRNPRVLIAMLRPARFTLRLYHVLFFLVTAFLILISVERCCLLPVALRDMIVGPDLVAKYAVQQGRLASTVFTDAHLQGHLSNQPFYAPFTALMQIVFRLVGLPFGQVWLSAILIAFVVFLYSRLSETLHPVLAGFLGIAFLTNRELYAHTFMISTDFSNAIFFGMSVVFFEEYFRRRQAASFLVSSLFMGFACWSRSETILLVPPGALLALGLAWRQDGVRVGLRLAVIFALIPAAFFALWHLVYFHCCFPEVPQTQIHWGRYPLGELVALGGEVARVIVYPGIYGYLRHIFAASLAGYAVCRVCADHPSFPGGKHQRDHQARGSQTLSHHALLSRADAALHADLREDHAVGVRIGCGRRNGAARAGTTGPDLPSRCR